VFRKSLLLFSLVVTSIVTTCIIPDTTAEQAEIDLQRNDSLMVVETGDFNFRIALPKDLMINNKPRIQTDDEGKKLYISCGPEFNLLVTTPDVEYTDWGIFKHHVLDHENDLCVYKRILPDGSVYDYGISQRIAMNDRTYLFQSDPAGEFDLNDALRMKLALTSLKL